MSILFKLRHNISIYLGETRNSTSEFERGEDRSQTASQAKDGTLQTNNTGMIHNDSNISVGKEPGLVKQINDITDNDDPQLSVISSKDTDINKSSSQTDFTNNTTTKGKPGVTSSYKMEPSKHKKACTERIPSDDTNSVAVTTYSQKPSTGQGSALPKGKEAVLTSQQSNTISQSSSAQSTSAQSINATSNIAMEQINDTTLRKDSVIQSGSNATINNTELKEINNSTSQPLLELHKEQGTTVASESQSHITQSKTTNIWKEKTRCYEGMTENILGSMRSQEKRAPLLAVVKPSSTRTLTKNIAQQSVADSQPLSTPFNIFTSEAANTHTDMINVSTSHNSNNIADKPCSQVLSSNQDYLQAPSQICTYTFTSTKALPPHFTNVNTQLPKETPREGDQHPEHTSSVNEGLAKNTNQGISDQKSSKSVTEARVLRSRVTNNQPLSSRHPTTKMPVLDQSIKSPLRSNQSKKERKQESKSTNDFCFSDGEDDSIPQVIGSQVDRIEMFLKNERLRLSKKRKTTDE